MRDDFSSKIGYFLKWAYTLLVVTTLMLPVFYVMYISFNKNGFGARSYDFTFDWYLQIFSRRDMIGSLGNSFLLAAITMVVVVPMGLVTAKLYKTTQYPLAIVSLMLTPLFVPSDILGSALLVFFKNANNAFEAFGGWWGVSWFDTWFQLGYFSAIVALIIYTLPYVFIVILITIGRYREQQTEAARSCGATAWQAFWHVEFPQIRVGIFSAAAFTVILTFNEYTRTALVKGGFDTFTTVLISEMLSEGMSEKSYAFSGLISYVAIAVIGTIVITTMIRSKHLERVARAKAEPVMA